MPWKATALLTMSMIGNAAATTVYVWVDADGVRHFGDHPPALHEGERIRIRPPNLADSFRPLPPRASERPPAVAERPALRTPKSSAEPPPRCRELRVQARVLRDRRRKGYALSEERSLDREARALLDAMRRYCD